MFDAKEWFENYKSKPLVDGLVHANAYLTVGERAKILIRIAKELKLRPEDVTKISMMFKE